MTLPWRAWVGLPILTVDLPPLPLNQCQGAKLLNYVTLPPPHLRPRPPRHLRQLQLQPTTSEPRPIPIHTQALHILMFLSRLSRVLPTTSFRVLTSHHAWSTRSNSRSSPTPTTPGSYSSKRSLCRGSPNVVIPSTTFMAFRAIGSGPCELRIIGATTLKFL